MAIIKRTTDQLSEQEIEFCHAYLANGGKAKEAAEAAGYAPATIKPQMIHHLLRRPRVSAYLDQLRVPMAQKAEITRDRVLAEYAKIAFFDIRKLYDPETGALKEVADLDDDTAGAVTGIEFGEMGLAVKKVTVSDKKAALDSIARMLGYNEPEKHLVAAVVTKLPDTISVEELERLAMLEIKTQNT